MLSRVGIELERASWADFFESAVDADLSFFLLVDLDNEDQQGPYRHKGRDSIELLSITMKIVKVNANAEWSAKLGIIVRINATNADVIWIPPSGIELVNSMQFAALSVAVIYPRQLDLTVVEEDDPADNGLKFVTSRDKETAISGLNTGTPIPNASPGGSTAPGLGDLIVEVIRDGPNTATISAFTNYRVG